MDIDLLSKMVKELILDNDEVALPGVGSFVTEIIPSNFSDKGYTINPPYRRLYFRQKQNSEDTQLSDFYAKSNNIDTETAKVIISDFLSEMKEILLHKRIIVFPGLGRLRATKENNLFFIADEELDIYPEGFGLEPISLKTHQETKEEVSEAIESLKSIMEEPTEEQIPEPVAEPVEEVTEEVTEEVAEEVEEETVVEAAEPAEDQIPKPAAEPVEEVEAEDVEDVLEEKVVTIPIIEKPKSKKMKKAVLAIIIILSICIIALAAFIITGHIAPDFIDQLLYSPEELELLKMQ